jgi:citrate lyase subunit beta / citryl-CoA lyase
VIYREGGKCVPVRRSLLWVAGNDPANLENVNRWGADVITLDLEDTVAVGDKPKARQVIVEAFQDCNFGQTEKWVRINGLDTTFYQKDLEAIVPASPDAICLPKPQSADDVRYLDRILAHIEQERGMEIGRTKVVLNIESALAVLHLLEMATASSRIIGLVLGGEDFTESLKIPRPTRGLELSMLFGRQQVITVARAIGVSAFDSVYMDTEDMEGLTAEAKMVKDLGMDGKNVIHPKQVPVVNEAFTPTSDEIDSAVRVIQAYEEAGKKSEKKSDWKSTGRANETSGTIPYVKGKFIDPPVVRKAWQVVRWAQACGVPVSW